MVMNLLGLRGGLKIPSVTLMETVQIMEKEFQKLHGDNLSKLTGVMKYLTNILQLLLLRQGLKLL